ncbi:hypothetical protein U1Q18_012076 [Sarracenia purpurea var. burkii]
MALAKKRTNYDPQIGFVEACAYYNNDFGSSSAQFSDQSTSELCVFNEHHRRAVADKTDAMERAGGFISKKSRCSSLSSPSSTSSASYVYGGGSATHRPEETRSVIDFRPGCNTTMMQKNGPFLSFEQTDQVIPQDDWSIWGDDLKNSRLFQDFDCVRSTGFHDTMNENPHGGGDQPFGFGWPSSEANGAIETGQEFGAQEPCFHREESMQVLKKQCTSATRKPRPKSTPSKDPQSVAAKNRRERISERLKILQELVPNGSKVDLVTMLEKAISYVKFLQLQVKVLATDEFWPIQGGKAPDLSQVKEAIDAILSSQKDRNSSSE